LFDFFHLLIILYIIDNLLIKLCHDFCGKAKIPPKPRFFLKPYTPHSASLHTGYQYFAPNGAFSKTNEIAFPSVFKSIMDVISDYNFNDRLNLYLFFQCG